MDGQRNDKGFQELLERFSRQIQQHSERLKELEEGADWTKGQIQHLHYIQGWNEELENRLHCLYPDDE